MGVQTINTVTAQQATIQVYEGDTITFTATATDNSGNPINLSTYTAIVLTVKAVGSTGSALLTFALSTGITIGGTGNNIATFSKIAVLKAGTYSYDCQTTLPDGVTKQTWIYGNFVVTQSVTTTY